MTGITRMSRMTRSNGVYPFLNKKFKDFQGHISHESRLRKQQDSKSAMPFSPLGGSSLHRLCRYVPR